MKQRLYLILACCLSVTPVAAQPPFLVSALKYGAEDCRFCHATANGEGHNERGQWLLTEKEKRGATAIDVDWLSARDVIVEEPHELVDDKPAAVVSRLPPLKRNPDDSSRPFDYTTRHGEWPAYGGDLRATKYSALNEVNRATVGNLEVAWTWEVFDNFRFLAGKDESRAPDPFKATPLMVAGRLFIRTSYSAVEALDPLTGTNLWTYDPGTGEGPRPGMFGFSSRGLAYHRGREGDRVVLLASDGYLIALSPETGEPIESFGDKGRVDLTKGLRRQLVRRQNSWNYPPAMCGDTIVVGNQTTDGSHYSRDRSRPWNLNLPLGDVRGFDAVTGEQLWVFKTVPQAGEVGNETWGNDSWRWMGNTNVWSMMSCDPDLGHVYLPVTAPTHHFYGGFRPGDNLFATSIVALDASSGERIWHFQAVHHDIWDYDLPAAPVVTDIVVNGKPVKAVAQVGKTGFVYVINRVTGEPVWPIEERPVPQSQLVGEQTSPTQPFPTWPPPFEPNGVTEEDLIDFTPALRKEALKVAKGHMGPMFTPPSEAGSLMNPGYGGGANWGGASFDPGERVFYVASRRFPTLLTARRVDEERFGWEYSVRTSSLDVDGIPIIKPPWGSITAYDLDTGEILWKLANGPGMKTWHPILRQHDLPDLGDGQAPGLLITKELVFHGHRGRPSELWARDKRTGKLLWQGEIPGYHMTAPPMTYMADGKQYIAVAVGGLMNPAELVAMALPDQQEAD